MKTHLHLARTYVNLKGKGKDGEKLLQVWFDLFFREYNFEEEKENHEEKLMKKAVQKTLADVRLTERGKMR